MLFSYFRPDAAIANLASSYYDVRLPVGLEDVMRAEIANVRFVLTGMVSSNLTGEWIDYPAPAALLCGATDHASRIRFSEGTHIFGVAITPMGWAKLFGLEADQYTNKVLDMKDVLSPDALSIMTRVFETMDDPKRAALVDELFLTLESKGRQVNEEFIDAATEWLVDPEPKSLEDFMANFDLSHRQIDRLCRRYFGSSPKKLHRKFRALHAANRLCWEELSDWRDIAASTYYDQAHFSREFKEFNGRSPKEFINGPHLLVRMTLTERRRIVHESPFSLVG